MLFLTLRGTPTMYYSDGFRMESVAIPPDREHGPWVLRAPGLGPGRDPARTPMRWDGSENAGFADPVFQPWLPLGVDATTLNVACERDHPDSMLSLTRRLLELRETHRALASGDYAAVDGTGDAVYVYLRSYEDERFLVAINSTGRPASFGVP